MMNLIDNKREKENKERIFIKKRDTLKREKKGQDQIEREEREIQKKVNWEWSVFNIQWLLGWRLFLDSDCCNSNCVCDFLWK